MPIRTLPRVRGPLSFACASLIALLVAPSAGIAAGEVASTQSLEEITITAAKLRSLEQLTPTGSRLGLDARDTPATIDTIDSDQILGRGYRSVEEAADSLPGVTSGGSPGDPSQLSMRGFTGNQITVLHNGLYTGPANMTNRPQNAFNAASVEVLKGPASVLYGQGAIGGVINMVNKAPGFDTPSGLALASVGNFGTTNIGIGGSAHWGDTVAARVDVSRNATDGYVQHSPSDSMEATATLLWKAMATLDVQFTLDYLQDNPSTYFGTPLVPTAPGAIPAAARYTPQPLRGVISSSAGYIIDERMRFVNYNVADARIHSSQYWPQLLLKWSPNESLTVQNLAYFFHADRKWLNAETYQITTFGVTGGTLAVDRDRFYVFHDQDLYGDQASVTWKGALAGRPNTFVAGIDYSHLKFLRTRGFPDNDLVDAFNPSPGLFGPLLQPGELVPRLSPTTWNDAAVFFEDAADVSDSIKLVTGGRYDRLALDRKNYNTQGALLSNSFSQTYTSSNWRAGLVYHLNDYITPYVAWTTGKDPPGTNNILLVNAPEGKFALSSSRQVEAGIKASNAAHTADLTLAVYDIDRRDILSVDPISGNLLGSGEQKSRGIEASGNVAVQRNWTVSANAAYTDAKYGHYFDQITGSSVDAIGKRPADIPQWTANLWTSVRNIGGMPLELGGGVRYVGDRFANTANNVQLLNYTLVSLYGSYALRPSVLLTARVNNALDKAYVQWADVFYPSEVMLGSPRSYEIGFVTRF